MDNLRDILSECERLYNNDQVNSYTDSFSRIKFWLNSERVLTCDVEHFKQVRGENIVK